MKIKKNEEEEEEKKKKRTHTKRGRAKTNSPPGRRMRNDEEKKNAANARAGNDDKWTNEDEDRLLGTPEDGVGAGTGGSGAPPGTSFVLTSPGATVGNILRSAFSRLLSSPMTTPPPLSQEQQLQLRGKTGARGDDEVEGDDDTAARIAALRRQQLGAGLAAGGDEETRGFITSSQRKRGRRMSDHGGHGSAPPSARRRASAAAGIAHTEEDDGEEHGNSLVLMSSPAANIAARLDSVANTPPPASVVRVIAEDESGSGDDAARTPERSGLSAPPPQRVAASPSSTFFSPVFRFIGSAIGAGTGTANDKDKEDEEDSEEDNDHHLPGGASDEKEEEQEQDGLVPVAAIRSMGDVPPASAAPDEAAAGVATTSAVMLPMIRKQRVAKVDEIDNDEHDDGDEGEDGDEQEEEEEEEEEEENDDDIAAAAATAAVATTSGRSSGRWEHDVSELDELYLETLLFIQRMPPLDRFVDPHRECILPRKTRRCPKVTLVLDLDETLVHSSLEDGSNVAFSFPVNFNDQRHNVKVRCRPKLTEFMEHVSKLFEIVVFTASQRVYAESLLNILDPGREFIRHRVYRDSCVVVDGNFIKDLTVLGRDIRRTVIVDNSPQAFGFQLENGVPIESWFDDEEDSELMELLPFLDELVDAEDVRPFIRDKFRLREKAQYISNQLARGESFFRM